MNGFCIDYLTDHPLFNPEFEKEPARLRMWAGFLKKIHYRDELPFDVVISLIRAELGPEWDALKRAREIVNCGVRREAK